MKPKQYFFVVLGILGVIALGGGTGYYYGAKYMQQQSESLALRLAEQQTAQEQIETLSRLQVQYDRDIVPILPMIDAALPRDKKQTEILAQIQRLATGLGLPQFESVTMPGPAGLPSALSQTTQSGVVLALPINFSAKGSTGQLQSFTHRLETLNRYTNITKLTVKADDKAPSQTVYTYSLNAYIKP